MLLPLSVANEVLMAPVSFIGFRRQANFLTVHLPGPRIVARLMRYVHRVSP